jgi:HAD superfamily hydrolase (TIGR01549 family)
MEDERIRAVIWDLGGVIVRTEDYTRRDALAQSLGLGRLDLEEIVFAGSSGTPAQLGQIDSVRHWQNIGAHFGLPPDAMQAFQDDFWGGDTLDWSLVRYIRSLRPRYKTGLLSNAFTSLRHFVTQVWKFDDAFDDMIISAEVGMMKPDAAIYHLAAQRLGVTPGEAVFIDDMARNIIGAQAAGLRGVRFVSPQQVLADLNVMIAGGNDGRG